MFYSENILTKKAGSLGLVWVAANFQPGVHHISLSRREYCSVDIKNACKEVMAPRTSMALRLSANLMVGIVRIHCQQTHYIYVESKHVWQRLKHTYEKNRPTTDLPPGSCRAEAVTLPDPTSLFSLDTFFPGQDLNISVDSIPMEDMFSLSNALPPCTPSGNCTNIGQVAGSPFTADPRDISMEEETEAPLECLQIKVPGESGDFGDGAVLMEGQSVVEIDNVPIPSLDSSNNSAGLDDGWADTSGGSGGGVGELERVKEEAEEEPRGETVTDQVLLYDDKTNSFQLYNDREEEEQATPIVDPIKCTAAAGLPDVEPLTDGEKEVTSRIRARRKLAFDKLIRTKSSTLAENMESGHTTLRDKHTFCRPSLSRRVKPTVLLSQPTSVATERCPELLYLWRKLLTVPLSYSNNEHEFELGQLANPITSSHETTTSFPMMDREVVRGGPSISQTSSPGGSTAAVEVVRASDEQTMDSHHTTNLTAMLSDVSSFASRRDQSNLGFDTSSAQRMTSVQSRLVPLPGIDGLSPIPDVAEIETEASFVAQQELEFPDLDVSYGSSIATPVTTAVGDSGKHCRGSPVLESEPLAYFSKVASKMGGRLEIKFDELLPHNSSRRTASRAFSHILELVTSQVLTARQEKSYSTITLHRGPGF